MKPYNDPAEKAYSEYIKKQEGVPLEKKDVYQLSMTSPRREAINDSEALSSSEEDNAA